MIRVTVKNEDNKILLSVDTDDPKHAERIEQYHTYQGNKVSITSNL